MTTTKQKNARRLKKREKTGNGSSLVSFQKFLEQNKNLTPAYEPGITVLTRDEVAKHNSPSDMWTIYRGNVYNISPFLEYHPGGEEELLKAAGIDCTALYDQYHPWVNIDAVLGHLKLGPLRGNSPTKSKSTLVVVDSIDGHAKTPAIASPKSMDHIKVASPGPVSPRKLSTSPKRVSMSDENRDPSIKVSPRASSKLQSPKISPRSNLSGNHSVGRLTIKTSADSIPASPKRPRAKQVLNRPVGIFKAFTTVGRRV
jgi:cytochrome b involved in lipid metabolism